MTKNKAFCSVRKEGKKNKKKKGKRGRAAFLDKMQVKGGETTSKKRTYPPAHHGGKREKRARGNKNEKG